MDGIADPDAVEARLLDLAGVLPHLLGRRRRAAGIAGRNILAESHGFPFSTKQSAHGTIGAPRALERRKARSRANRRLDGQGNRGWKRRHQIA